MKRTMGCVAGLVVGWLILRPLGEDTAAAILSAIPYEAGNAGATALIIGGPALAVGVALAARSRTLRAHAETGLARYAAAAVAAFYCAGLGVGGILDWNPFLIALVVVACLTAGAAVLRVKPRTTSE